MLSSAQLQSFAQWSGYFTLFCAVLTGLGLLLKWGVRFRLVGVTGFMAVLTGGLFALSLSLFTRPHIEGAARFARVFDTGANYVVIAVSPQITETALTATLRQAAIDLYSPGRASSQGEPQMTIRARTVVHPQPGISRLLYLGQVQRSLASREDEQMTIDLYPDQFAQLPQPTPKAG